MPIEITYITIKRVQIFCYLEFCIRQLLIHKILVKISNSEQAKVAKKSSPTTHFCCPHVAKKILYSRQRQHVLHLPPLGCVWHFCQQRRKRRLVGCRIVVPRDFEFLHPILNGASFSAKSDDFSDVDVFVYHHVVWASSSILLVLGRRLGDEENDEHQQLYTLHVYKLQANINVARLYVRF